jgi:quercetin dioxygenase-like cupin family protein
MNPVTRHADTHGTAIVVDATEIDRRVIQPNDFVADTAAFVDVRLPRSNGKASYSFIGPGVAQNANQVINLSEPHGFNIGAATMPHGVINNPHLHFTAEVFICTRGNFVMTVGEHGEQRLPIGPGTIFSVPTWVFRGFENVGPDGPDDAWMFTVLGGDDTGGIIWAPRVLRAAAETGLHLTNDWAVVESNGSAPADGIEPFTPEQLNSIDTYSDDALAARTVEFDALSWSPRALLSSVVPGHQCAIAPVIGAGLTEDRTHTSPVSRPHGFSVEWLRIEPGSSTGAHRHHDSQVLLLVDGEWSIEINRDADAVERHPATGSVVSIPEGAWRNYTNIGDTVAHTVVVCGGDHPTRLEWDATLANAAAADGWGLDASGYLAPLHLLGARS